MLVEKVELEPIVVDRASGIRLKLHNLRIEEALKRVVGVGEALVERARVDRVAAFGFCGLPELVQDDLEDGCDGGVAIFEVVSDVGGQIFVGQGDLVFFAKGPQASGASDDLLDSGQIEAFEPEVFLERRCVFLSAGSEGVADFGKILLAKTENQTRRGVWTAQRKDFYHAGDEGVKFRG